MYAATVLVTISKPFVPACYKGGQSPSLTYTLGKPQDISAKPVPGMFTQQGNCIVVSVPKGYPGSVDLIYQLPSTDFVLLGAMFSGPKGSAGRLEFHTMSLQRDLTGSQLTVTDACLEQDYWKTYSYTLIVQDVATGNIGIIDPDEETDPVEPPVTTKSAVAKVPPTKTAPAPAVQAAPPKQVKR